MTKLVFWESATVQSPLSLWERVRVRSLFLREREYFVQAFRPLCPLQKNLVIIHLMLRESNP
jgi:hypothetical protein